MVNVDVGAIKSDGGQENRSAKDYSDVILKKGYDEKLRKYSDKAKASNVSFVPLERTFHASQPKP